MLMHCCHKPIPGKKQNQLSKFVSDDCASGTKTCGTSTFYAMTLLDISDILWYNMTIFPLISL